MEMLYFEDSPSDHYLMNFPCVDIDDEKYCADGWTFEENKEFEKILAGFDVPDSFAFLEYVALQMPWKSLDSIKTHYQLVVDNKKKAIQESGEEEAPPNNEVAPAAAGAAVVAPPSPEANRPNTNCRKRKANPWTAQEHKLFLLGLEKYGKGDWRSIAKYYVRTKSPTQVASHGQKFFSRRTSSTPIEKRRPSIHDIQTIESDISLYPPKHRIPEQPPTPTQMINNNSNSNQVANAIALFPNYSMFNTIDDNNNNSSNNSNNNILNNKLIINNFDNMILNNNNNNNNIIINNNNNNNNNNIRNDNIMFNNFNDGNNSSIILNNNDYALDYTLDAQLGNAAFPVVNPDFQVYSDGDLAAYQAWINQDFGNDYT